MEETKNTKTELSALRLIKEIDKRVQATPSEALPSNGTRDDSGNSEQRTVVEIGDIEDINIKEICAQCAGCTSSD